MAWLWKKNMASENRMHIDTNYLLRYVLNDIPEQAEKAAAVIMQGAEIYPEIVPEAVYVLQKIYKIERKDVSAALLDVLDDVSVERKRQIQEALVLYGRTNLDYVDCLLLSGFLYDRKDFATFDKKLQSRKKNLSSQQRSVRHNL